MAEAATRRTPPIKVPIAPNMPSIIPPAKAATAASTPMTAVIYYLLYLFRNTCQQPHSRYQRHITPIEHKIRVSSELCLVFGTLNFQSPKPNIASRTASDRLPTFIVITSQYHYHCEIRLLPIGKATECHYNMNNYFGIHLIVLCLLYCIRTK